MRYVVPAGKPAPVSVAPPRKRRKKHPFQGFIAFQGLKIHVENVRGSYREGVDGDGHKWRVRMRHHYGEIEGTEGVDGDPLDVYVGTDRNSPLAVIVHQQDPTAGRYDEDKCMLGFASVPAALAAYRAQYDRLGFYGGHTTMPVGQLLTWCEDRRKRGRMVKGALRKALELRGLDPRRVLRVLGGAPMGAPKGKKTRGKART